VEVPRPAAEPTPASQPAAAVPAGQPGRFSADGFWWWDGANWRPAYSQDRLWRWTGQTWVPSAGPPTRAGGGAGLAIGLGLGLFLLIVVAVAVVVVVILGTMGNQFLNIFSNVAAALGSPSPNP
jgi:hypothetical protein